MEARPACPNSTKAEPSEHRRSDPVAAVDTPFKRAVSNATENHFHYCNSNVPGYVAEQPLCIAFGSETLIGGVEMPRDDSDRRLLVVINDGEQHSIWPIRKPLPARWRAEGTEGNKADCLAHIERVCTDRRSLSLRKAQGGVQ